MEELFAPTSNLQYEQIRLENALRRRLIYLTDEINEDTVFEIIYLLDRIIALDKLLETKEPITIRLRTVGGSVNHGLGLIGKIERMKRDGYEIICESEGMVISMGVPIMVSCSKRYGHEYDMYLIHNVAGGVQGTLPTMKNYLEESKRLEDICNDIIVKNTKITKKKIESKTSGLDWYIGSKEALELGLIDGIL